MRNNWDGDASDGQRTRNGSDGKTHWSDSTEKPGHNARADLAPLTTTFKELQTAHHICLSLPLQYTTKITTTSTTTTTTTQPTTFTTSTIFKTTHVHNFLHTTDDDPTPLDPPPPFLLIYIYVRDILSKLRISLALQALQAGSLYFLN